MSHFTRQTRVHQAFASVSNVIFYTRFPVHKLKPAKDFSRSSLIRNPTKLCRASYPAIAFFVFNSPPSAPPFPRVLPRAHTRGMMSNAEVALLARDVQAVDCVTPAGGVVAMRPLLVHAPSTTARAAHRYGDSLDMGAGLELAIA